MTALNQSQPLMVASPAPAARGQGARRSLGQWLIITEAVLAFLFIYIPILILIVYSFNASRFSSNWEGFTLSWYRSLLQGGGVLGLGGVDEAAQRFAAQGILHSLRNSLIIATIATVIATTLGTMIALAMQRYRFKLRQVVDIMLYLPIIIPEITMGISLVIFFNLLFRLLSQVLGITAVLGFPTIIISHVAFNISFVAVVVRARLAGMDPALEEAAQDAGANDWQVFWRIVFPLIMPGVLGGALMAFTLSLDDFVITFYTAGIGSTTLPLFVYGMIKFTVTPAINAISTLMMIGSMVLVTLSLVLQRQQ